jgi:hypothetical protein
MATSKTSKTKVVPVSDPAHPSHASWLDILLTALKAASSIGPAVVAVVDPGDAKLASDLGGIANASLDAAKGQGQ